MASVPERNEAPAARLGSGPSTDPGSMADTDPTLRAVGDTIPHGIPPIAAGTVRPAVLPGAGRPAATVTTLTSVGAVDVAATATLGEQAAPVPPDATKHGPSGSPAPSRARSALTRTLVALALIAVLLTSLWLDSWVFVGLVVVLVSLGLIELVQALRGAGLALPLVPTVACGVALVVVARLSGVEGLVVAFLLASFACLVWRRLEGGGTAVLWDTAGAVFALAYVPLAASFLVLMIQAPQGPWRVLFTVCLCIGCDTGGYVVGSLIGRHKMAPTVSPKKSWEGLAGSFALTIGVGVVGLQLLGGQWWQGAALGLAALATATLGDLGESLLKRDLGLKDMGNLLPGHGGVLDRVDSILMTAPMAFLGLLWAIGA